MKRLYLIVLMALGIALGSMAQTDALVVEQNNGLADILKVSANLRIENNTDGTISVKDGNNIVATYARADIKRIAFNDEKALTDSVERAALIALYNATDGANWTNNTNWCSEKPLNEWYGITTNEGHVTRLLLYSNNLKGEIPPELGNLRELKSLELHINQLTGSIPDALKNLVNLENFNVSQNLLTGSIPKWIGNCEHLRSLNLELNNFSGEIPSELGQLSELEDLRLRGIYRSNIRITGEIPKSFGELKNLRVLWIVETGLTGSLPAELGNLSELSNLQIVGNSISGEIPAELGNLSNLTCLDLSANKLSGKIPAELGNLTQLRTIDLSSNSLSGEIPAELGNLTKLTKLNLSSNNLSGEIPESFSNFQGLIQFSDYYGRDIFNISTNYNNLSGKIPSLFTNSQVWYKEWTCFLEGNPLYNLEDDVIIPAPPFAVKDIDGNILDSKIVYPNNKYTAIYHWTPNDNERTRMRLMVAMYNKYKDYGLEVIGLLHNVEEGKVRSYISNAEIGWRNFISTENNMLDYVTSAGYPKSGYSELSLVDTKGNVVFSDCVNKNANIYSFLKEHLGEGNPDVLTDEERDRRALIALYNALGGDNWTNNTNWCSDKPLSEWYGVKVKGEHVAELRLSDNQLRGEIPTDIGNLKDINVISLRSNHLTGKIPDVIGNLTNLEVLELSENNLEIDDLSWLSNCKVLSEVYLSHLNLSHVKLKDFCGLTQLKDLSLSDCNLTGTIPKEIGNLKSLRFLYLGGNHLSGELPAEIGNLTNLQQLRLANNKLTGELPETLSNLKNLIGYFSYIGDYGFNLDLWGNYFSGKIPSMFYNSLAWYHEWPNIMFNCPNYNIEEDVYIPAPTFHVKDIDGNILDSKDIYPKNKYTAIFHWASWCSFSNALMKRIIPLYERYKDYGFEIIGLNEDEEEQTVRDYIIQKGIKWRNFISEGDNTMDYFSSFQGWKGVGYPTAGTPEITLIDSNGRIVFTDCINERFKITDFLRSKLGEGKPIESYTSTDYSADGNVKTLQTATTGKGIKVVIMGDGFTDRMIADGSYDKAMNKAMKALFSSEPIKNYRNQFTVMSVTAVSENEYFGESYKTAFSGYFGEGTHIGGNNAKVFEYAKKAISEDEMDDAIIIVIMNEERWAGTCYMYRPEKQNTWGSGATIAYVPNIDYTGTIEYETFESLLSHEAVGHGFAKLEDEYVNKDTAIPAEIINSYQKEFELGWWKNIDFTNNPAEVKWASFITDNRYTNEEIGVYEGAMTYPSGVYRPTENSIMTSRATDFNAPSRQAIWYRINKLTQGANWEGTYEDFVQFDKATYGAQASARRTQKQTEDSRIRRTEELRTAPPVVKTITWREEK